MMYDSMAVGVNEAFGVSPPVFPSPFDGRKRRKEWRGAEGWVLGVVLDHRLLKSRIICTFSIEEKVSSIRQLKEEAIIPDEDRWLVLVG